MTTRGRTTVTSGTYTRAGRRICVVGDGLVAGVGDSKGLGWTGRVASRTPTDGSPFALFALGVPDEPSSGLLERWREECSRRWHVHAENRLIVGVGRADIYANVSLARSRLNLAEIVDEATDMGVASMVVGPPPVLDPGMHDTIKALSEACADVCARRGIVYVDCFSPLHGHEQWYSDLASGDGYNPGQTGYGLLAWLVLNQTWEEWLGVEARKTN